MRALLPTAFLVSAMGVLAFRAPAAAVANLALLPLENLSSSEEGQHDLALLLGKGLETHGWHVVTGGTVETALDVVRVRYLDSIDSEARLALASSLGVETFALGTIYGYSGGALPFVAISLRLVAADGRVLFDELSAVRAEDTERIFGFDKPVTRDELAREAVRRITSLLPKPGAKPSAEHRRGKPMRLAPPITYRSEKLDAGQRHRVAILPFANAAPAREASRVVMSLLTRRLSGSKLFSAVEPADLRSGLVAEKVRDYSDPTQVRSLGKRLGTALLLSGTVYEYVEAPSGGRGTPRLELALTLTDVASGAIVWTSYLQRRGTDYSGVLQLGAISNVIGLADQAAYEMVHAAEKTKPTRAVAPKTTKTSGTKRETKS